MFDNVVDFGKQVEAEDLFKALKGSVYMKQGGYGILYARTYYENQQKSIASKKIAIKKSVKGRKIVGYGLCYDHDELIYIHIRILGAGKVNEFKYIIACGDEKRVEADLMELAKEIQKNLE